MSLKYELGFVVAMVLSGASTWVTIGICKRRGWVSTPRAERWHSGSPALYGGLPIVLAFCITSVFLLPLSYNILWAVIGLSVSFCGVGLYDDVWSLRPLGKLVLQLLGAGVLIKFGVLYHFRESMWINVAVTLLWVVGITNAFNLLDNIDGLASGIAIIAAGYLAYFYALIGNTHAVLVLLAFMGAVLGFLIFNFSPAKIFMGDAGSLFIGFFLASISAMETTHLSNLGAFLFVPVMILIVPIFDTAFVSLTRKLSGRPISVGGKDHTSHRLAALGLNDRKVVLIFYFLSGSAGMLAVFLHSFPHAAGSVIPLFLILITLLGLYLVSHGDLRSVRPEESWFLALTRSLLPLFGDLALISIAYYSAYLLRFGGVMSPLNALLFAQTLPIVIGSHIIAAILTGLYWDRPLVLSFYHVYRIVRLITISTFFATTIIIGLYRFEDMSRVVFLIFWILEVGLLSSARAAFGFFNLTLKRNDQGSRILILGSQDRAVLAANHFELLQPGSVLGLVGTGPTETGKIIDKFSVIGSIDDIEDIVSKYRVSQLVVATEVNLDWVAHVCLNNTQLEVTEFEWRIRSLRSSLARGKGARVG